MFEGSDDSDTEIKFKTNNEYAKNYDTWRQKEILNSLKTKYKGDLNTDDESSSSDEDDSDIELSDKVEMDFLKTLSSLKNKDPKIYDESVKFFGDIPIDPTVRKKKKEQPLFLKDYERTMLLKHGETVFDEEENNDMPDNGLSYVQEQENIKNSLKMALDNVDNDDSDKFGGLFQTRMTSKEEKDKEEASYKLWLKGQKDNLNNEEDETSLKPLKDHWNDPNLDEGEKFLRDYILNNRFKETNDPNYVPTYDEIVHDDEKFSDDEENVDKQEEFEHKFNYRFEEPDQEFLKRYPRTVQNSLRKTDDRRRVKRHELKERKEKEKKEKMEDIQKLKAIKRKEMEEKLKKLKEITGNSQVAFEDNDLDDDFDPDAHDKRMQALFNDKFYMGEEGDEKPEFPDLDAELGIERWDIHHKEQINNETDSYDNEPHAEDEDFNMDCEYDPTASTQDELIENSKRRKKRKRKSKFAKAVAESKPLFDPNDKTYEKYLEEYYKLDCEDIVGGIPCRFKYRQVTPNNFGLTIEEILTANDKELNRWCSIKKAMQYRPDNVEKYDQIAYSKKAQNEALKQKILPSLYSNVPQYETAGILSTTANNNINDEAEAQKVGSSANNRKNKRGKANKNSRGDPTPKKHRVKNLKTNDILDAVKYINESSTIAKNSTKQTKSNLDNLNVGSKDLKTVSSDADTRTKDEFLGPVVPTTHKEKKKKKVKQARNLSNTITGTPSKINTNANFMKRTLNGNKAQNNKAVDKKTENNKSKKGNQTNSLASGISDARLQAFGIKPKKFRNKLKYGNKGI